MAKLEIYHQQSMDAKIVPPAEKKESFNSFAEMFQSDDVEIAWKLNWIAQVSKFETLNSITKHDLHEALKWLYARTRSGGRIIR